MSDAPPPSLAPPSNPLRMVCAYFTPNRRKRSSTTNLRRSFRSSTRRSTASKASETRGWISPPTPTRRRRGRKKWTGGCTTRSATASTSRVSRRPRRRTTGPSPACSNTSTSELRFVRCLLGVRMEQWCTPVCVVCVLIFFFWWWVSSMIVHVVGGEVGGRGRDGERGVLLILDVVRWWLDHRQTSHP